MEKLVNEGLNRIDTAKKRKDVEESLKVMPDSSLEEIYDRLVSTYLFYIEEDFVLTNKKVNLDFKSALGKSVLDTCSTKWIERYFITDDV